MSFISRRTRGLAVNSLQTSCARTLMGSTCAKETEPNRKSFRKLFISRSFTHKLLLIIIFSYKKGIFSSDQKSWSRKHGLRISNFPPHPPRHFTANRKLHVCFLFFLDCVSFCLFREIFFLETYYRRIFTIISSLKRFVLVAFGRPLLSQAL